MVSFFILFFISKVDGVFRLTSGLTEESGMNM